MLLGLQMSSVLDILQRGPLALVLIQQGRYIASLSMWLVQFNARAMPVEYRHALCASNELEHALALRMACTSILTRVSTVLDTREESYDMYASRLKQIILNTGRILSLRDARRLGADKYFSQDTSILGLGIIEPLFQAAETYKDCFWRKRPIICLLRSGMEPPLHGRREAAIAQRVMQYEEIFSEDVSSITS